MLFKELSVISQRFWQALIIAVLTSGLASPALAEPPPWAPAHGYYKNKNKYKDHDDHYSAEIEYHGGGGNALPALHCEHSGAQTGAVIGGIVGGVLGSNIGKGDGKTLATIAGTIFGAYVGKSIGADMDAGDQRCAGETFEVAQDNQPVEWSNPDTQQDYTVTPRSSYQDQSGQYCREYTSEVVIDGRKQTSTGTACKQASGEWRIIN
jgi:surface antigen